MIDLSPKGLLKAGADRCAAFCRANGIESPAVDVSWEKWRVNSCAYYRTGTISICLPLCARPGYGGRAWSWPGYVIDRTPYGVLAHELGHHADVLNSTKRGKYSGDFSRFVRRTTKDAPLTGYCPDDGEWFAEHFRLFVTNPDLLMRVRPRTWELLATKFRPVTANDWLVELCRNDAPDRILAMARKKITQAGT